jgi:hypothetical protein
MGFGRPTDRKHRQTEDRGKTRTKEEEANEHQAETEERKNKQKQTVRAVMCDSSQRDLKSDLRKTRINNNRSFCFLFFPSSSFVAVGCGGCFLDGGRRSGRGSGRRRSKRR